MRSLQRLQTKQKTAVQQTVNTQFISTLIKSCMQVSDGLIDSSVLEEETGSSNVIDMLIGKLEEADADLAVYENLLDSLMSVSGMLHLLQISFQLYIRT